MSSAHGRRTGPCGLEDENHLDERQVAVDKEQYRYEAKLAAPDKLDFFSKSQNMVENRECCRDSGQ